MPAEPISNPAPWVTFGPRHNHVQCHHCGCNKDLGYPLTLPGLREKVAGFMRGHRKRQGAMPHPKRITPTTHQP